MTSTRTTHSVKTWPLVEPSCSVHFWAKPAGRRRKGIAYLSTPSIITRLTRLSDGSPLSGPSTLTQSEAPTLLKAPRGSPASGCKVTRPSFTLRSIHDHTTTRPHEQSWPTLRSTPSTPRSKKSPRLTPPRSVRPVATSFFHCLTFHLLETRGGET